MNFKYNLTISATNQTEAETKIKALVELAKNFDTATLQALAHKGPGIMRGPFGGMVKKQLGLRN
ncbi:MAG: hypothetical protein AAF998_18450 [Bacteroidota bacterium]